MPLLDQNVESRLIACLDRVKIPFPYDRVFKDECVLSFDTPLSKGGLYLNLKTLRGYGEEFVSDIYNQSEDDFPVYLHIKWTKVPLSEEEMAELEATPEKMAIGVPGGFQVDKEKFKVEKTLALVLFPDRMRIPLPCEALPLKLHEAISKIQEHDSVTQQQAMIPWEEEKPISQYAEYLEQLPAEQPISMNPADWVCEDSGLSENLWLNLSTGYIGSGRKNWSGPDGTGAALRHYQRHKKEGKVYPLAVKLGTITAAGADVYSYASDEDCMVIDPYLEKHLLHWGIEIDKMEKTARTTNELQIDLNAKAEFNRMTEADADLIPVYGPCYIGLQNLGNSCYMNAVLQVLWMVPAVRKRYLENAELVYQTTDDPSQDFHVQMTKIGTALIYARTGRTPEEGIEERESDLWSVRPLSFKTLIGQGNPDFSSSHQQDAAEYFMHLLTVMDNAENAALRRLDDTDDVQLTSSMFSYLIEERVQCSQSHRVSYNTAQSFVLQLDIPLEKATNKEDVDEYKDRQLKRQKLQESGADAEILIESTENGDQRVVELTKEDNEEKVVPNVPFAACLSQFTANVTVFDYYSRFLKARTTAVKNTKFKTFPPFLLIQMKRYYHDDAWQPKKMEVLVEAPDELNLEGLRGDGIQPGEELQPELPDGEVEETSADRNLVEQLMTMGFSENGCIRAAMAVDNASVETALEWALLHSSDPNFNDPLSSNSKEVDAEKLRSLMDMGFGEKASRAALVEKKNDESAAIDWLISNVADLDAKVAEIMEKKDVSAKDSPSQYLDGEGLYELVGFISHMGSSTACGHYVCHVKKNGRWILFNDEKVAVSASPPLDLGFLYLYRRKDVEGVVE